MMLGKKHDLRKLLPILSALLLAFFVSGCGQATDTSGLVGVWILESAEREEIALPDSVVAGNRVELRLDPGGSGLISGENFDGRVKWSFDEGSLTLRSGSVEMTGFVEDGTVVLLTADGETELRFRNGTEPFEADPKEQIEKAFLGDWYGWWKIEGSDGEMPVSWYDCCASFSAQEDETVLMSLWDEDGSRTEPLSQIVFVPSEEHRLVSLNGYFDLMEIHKGDLALEQPDPAILISEFRHNAQGENFLASIYLRPWGDDWGGAPEGQRPFYFDDWYFPLQKKGAAMPDEIPWKRLEKSREMP